MAHHGRRNADEALALALASGQSLRAAAAATGVSERTAARRQADPAFRRRVGELRGEMVRLCIGRVVDGMAEAANVFRELLNARREATRLAAARALLELGTELHTVAELERRLEDIEAHNATPGAGRP